MTIFVGTSGTAITSWYDEVLPFVNGLGPGPFVLRSIMAAVIEYCEKTKVLQMAHPAMDIVANQPTYTFNPSTDLLVVSPMQVWVNGVQIYEHDEQWFDDNCYGWRTTPSDPASGFYCPDENTIQIVPTPASSYTGGLTMNVAVKPKANSTSVDSKLWDHQYHRLAIASGAMAYCMAANGFPWSDKDGAEKRRGEFESQMGSTSALVAKGRTRNPLRSSTVHGVR